VAPFLGMVHHVVVDQREVVDELERRRGGQHVLVAPAHRLRDQRHQQRADLLAADAAGGPLVSEVPAELVIDDLPQDRGNRRLRGARGAHVSVDIRHDGAEQRFE